MMSKKFLLSIREFFFPSICMSCGKIIENEGKLCANCEKSLAVIDKNKRCLFCGGEKPDCECRHSIFYFNGAVSPFFNKGSAKNIVYRYKLGGKTYYKDYIADKMYNSLNEAFSNIKFDMIVPVPTTKVSKYKKGYDHTFELAKELANKMDIPVRNNVLGVRQLKKSQHNSGLKQRFLNVTDKYYIKNKISCDNLLLVDDIKTSGATLNACSRQLLFAGAKHVYCITALSSESKK